MFGLTNAIPEIFSFNDQMFTTPPPPFLTVFIFIITSCAFEAVMTPFLHKYHSSLQHWPLMHSSICLIYLLKKYLIFPETPLQDSHLSACYFYISLPSPVCSNCSNKVNFRFRNSSKKYTVPISWRSDAKSMNDNGFLSHLANGFNFFFGLATRGLFFLPRYAKSSLSKFKSLKVN